MKGLTPASIAKCCGGKLFCNDDIKNVEIKGAAADSRQAGEGFMFIPVKGARVDGHDFIPQVFENGAMITLTEYPETAEKYPCILVDSTLEAIKDIARYYLTCLDVKVVAVTGSVGKTSTKEFVASVLEQKYRTKKTIKNLNNAIGLPYSIFTIEDDDEVAVLEMGINHFDEMRELSSIAPPDMAVYTNIGTCHLEFLGDRDGVLRAKTEMFENLKEGAVVVLNGEDDKLRTIAEVNGVKPIFVGFGKDCDIYADEIENLGIEGMRCRVHYSSGEFVLQVPKPGEHQILNALEAVAVGLNMGLTTDEIAIGLMASQSMEGRFNIIKTDKYTLIDDCYNANPMSMKASCEILSRSSGRKVAVLGNMGELGEKEEQLHEDVGRFIANLDIDVLVVVGELAGKIADAASENKKLITAKFADTDGFIAECGEILEKEDIILIKASHSMNFAGIVNYLSKE